ncbi:hypothetical protein [Hymenobacter properus]|uniref:Uncharacterized protein n=1 Tax=Hymenobacter properus TaxID=2791026 RepID=A0A931FKR3_9BACT|nr:hypothetical protein [Hymenobacter properus]MBF9141990.1 hypothetical protein [Hymenobacter properus]MBR7720797.1 hypothetical protein [Microvirga sp. SRT04]
MKRHLYSFVLGALLIFAHSAAQAANSYLPTPDNPTEMQRKAAAAERRAAAREKVAAAKQVSKMKKLSVKTNRFAAKMQHVMFVVLGLEESKGVTSPRQLRRQLHGHQKQLKLHAKMQSRIRRSHTHD